jgi:hypothetical protein
MELTFSTERMRSSSSSGVAPPRGALEWLAESDTIAKQSRLTRLKDGSSTLLDQYSELLRGGQVEDEVRQQIGELRTSVLAAGIVQLTDNLMQLTDELRRDTVVGDHKIIRTETQAVAAAHNAFASDGEQRLARVESEMRAALREREDSYNSTGPM